GGVDMRPGPSGCGPDVAGDLHAARVVDGAGAHHHEPRVRVAMAVNGRATLAAEVPAQRASALRGRVVVALGRALSDPEILALDHGIHRAAGAGGLLAVGAMAGPQAGHRGGDGVTDGAAEAAA